MIAKVKCGTKEKTIDIASRNNIWLICTGRKSMEEQCRFCEIIKGERKADFVYEDDTLVVFKDIYPAAPVHLLVVPRKHIRSINDLEEEDLGILQKMFLKAKNIAQDQGIADKGYKLLINVERGGGQVIFHLHMHLFGGWRDKPHHI
jgi:histidine triad (HIT) family protein